MKTRNVAVTMAVVAGLALTGCSASEEPTESPTGELIEVTLGVLPSTPTAALQVGIDEGFFEEEGLELTLRPMQGGAVMVPALVAGELQFGMGQILSLLQANENGIEIEAVSGFTTPSEETPADVGVWVKPESGIESVLDLAGKTVSVNAVNTIGDTLLKAEMEQAGGDPDSIKFVEMAFGYAPAALASGNIDAALTPEPFGYLLASQFGAVQIAAPYQAVAPEIPQVVVFTSSAYAAESPDVVSAMAAAVAKTAEFAAANEDKVRSAVETVLEMDQATSAGVVLETFNANLSLSAIEGFVKVASDAGLLKKDADLAKIFPSAQ
jgi:NitT/TauT family transport system substrate-binding protein